MIAEDIRPQICRRLANAEDEHSVRIVFEKGVRVERPGFLGQ